MDKKRNILSFFTKSQQTSNLSGSVSLKESIIVEKPTGTDEQTIVIDSPLVDEPMIKRTTNLPDTVVESSVQTSLASLSSKYFYRTEYVNGIYLTIFHSQSHT